MTLLKLFVTPYHVSKGDFPPGDPVSTQGSIHAAWLFNLLSMYSNFICILIKQLLYKRKL